MPCLQAKQLPIVDAKWNIGERSILPPTSIRCFSTMLTRMVQMLTTRTNICGIQGDLALLDISFYFSRIIVCFRSN